ncbi:MAG: sigma-70 family RNA polymerase sigma factor [Chloroflexi bacterium]|nr:sigma-70 family RNA polymerase sigma factor [Chloroflexota bacterium]
MGAGIQWGAASYSCNISGTNSYIADEKPLTPNAETDSQLAARAIDGDAEAFGDLYERYQNAIYRYIYYRVGEQGEAEDLTETVFLKAWETMPRFRVDQASFKTWLYRVAHNLLVDHRRLPENRANMPGARSLAKARKQVATRRLRVAA